MQQNNSKIVTCARDWLGTKFVHQGRIKKSQISNGGCDCIGLIIGVLTEIDFKINNKPVSYFDELDYAMIAKDNKLLVKINSLLKKSDKLIDGGVAVFKFTKNSQHVGILAKISNDQFNLIHSYIQAGMVVEHRLDDVWQGRIVAVYEVGG